MKTINKLNIWLAYPLVLLIWLYQKTISPDHGLFKGLFPHGYCRFYPSCSAYSIKALKLHGLIPGIYYAVVRVAKCNPFVQPKVDSIN